MLTVREVGWEDQATAAAVGENYQRSSKELRWEKKKSLQVDQIKITAM